LRGYQFRSREVAMNFFDVIVIVIMVCSLFWGLYRGALKELFSVIGLYLGFSAAFHFYAGLSRISSTWMSGTFALKPLCFLIILACVFTAVAIIGTVILYLLKFKSTGLTQRLMGALLGGFKGIVIVSLLFVLVAVFLPEKTTLIKESLFSPNLAAISEVIAPTLSKKIGTDFKFKLAELRKE
jgi:membrane protein required for colicin V production